MNTIQFLKDRLLGKLVVLRITGTHVRICQGKRIPEYELPKTFQGYNYLNHAEEMAGWLQAILREERIQIRRFRIILDSEQVYLQTVKLPVMTVEEQKNWVFWEGSQYVPSACALKHAHCASGDFTMSEPSPLNARHFTAGL